MKLSVISALIFLASFPGSIQAQEKQSKKAFEIYERGVRISKADVKKDHTSSDNILQIEAFNISGGSIALSRKPNPVLPPAELTNISSLQGNYTLSRDLSKSGRGFVIQLLEVTYPYRARLTISEQILEFQINEPGFWRVQVSIFQ
jgi:hypothetical protein